MTHPHPNRRFVPQAVLTSIQAETRTSIFNKKVNTGQGKRILLIASSRRNQGRFDDTHVSDQPKEQLEVFSAAKVLADAAKIRRSLKTFLLKTRKKNSQYWQWIEVEINVPSPVATKDKGKAIMQESEPPKKIKRRVQIQMSIDKEIAQKLHQEEQDRFNLQAGEKYSEEDLPRKLVELVSQRNKFFAQQRVEAKRNKPMTPAQQKAYMSTYIKNQEGGYSIKELKSLSFEQVKEIFDTTMRRVQSFVPMDSELEDKRLKKAGQEGLEEPTKRQKIGEASGDDLVKLWSLVYERFNSTELTDDKSKELWVELKRGHDIFMLVENDYPLTRALMNLMLCNKLRVDEYSEMANELLRKIFILANRPRQ
ncbi:hypothetical protein Tco_0778770 [Tanacetum coccineum]